MTDSVTISLIGALATVFTAALNSFFAIRTSKRQRETGEHVKQMPKRLIKQMRKQLMPFVPMLPKPVDTESRPQPTDSPD
jgi:hypothetical protein